MIRLRVLLKISFDTKSDYSLLQILLTTLFLKKFKINLGSFISQYLNFYPTRLGKLIYHYIIDHGLKKIWLFNLGRFDNWNYRVIKSVSLKTFALFLYIP